ncbi:hypothetical protein DXB08_28165 [Hungatella hathewayi]|uniref:Uncharacterized protein n=2 Tax=Lachnospiraceae TaxID=186803 RepID=A0A3E4U1M2_9FIRM|nr:hypothetical protein DXC39_23785 [Hungatella hathewayi]RGO66316.1 hypothetical protein DXB08_28165 [Hungatella hathewayi]RHM71417.1 hypothetical protein DWZ48_26390 [Hungatella hathewayi]
MSTRFLGGTSMADLERVMQQAPGFRPRKSGIIRSHYPISHEAKPCEGCQYAAVKTAEEEDGGEQVSFSYGVLLALLTEELPSCALTVRIGRLQAEVAGRNPSPFETEEHRRRFQALVRCGSYPGIRTDSGFAAALFLLSSDSHLWGLAGPFVEERTIDYSRFRLRGSDLDGYALYCVAKELYTGKAYVTLSELGDPELFHDGLLRLIVHAILISRHGVKGVISEEEIRC